MSKIASLREQAEKCRRLARDVGDLPTKERLTQLAVECDAQADHMEAQKRDI